MAPEGRGRRVLIISYYLPPLGRGGVKRPTKFAKYLKRLGWEPVLLGVKPIAYYAFDPTLLEDLKGIPVFRAESLDVSRLVYWLGKRQVKASPLTEGISRSVFNTLLFPDAKAPWIPFAYWLGRSLAEKGLRPDLILSTSPPFSAHLIGLLLRRHYRVPLVVDFRDFWPTGLVPANPVMKPLYARLRRWIARQADAVIAVYQDIVEDLGFGEYLPSGYDPEELADLPAFDLKGEIPIAYTGSLSLKEDSTLALIRALREVPGFTLHLAGVVPGSILREVDGERVFYHGYLSARMALGFLKSARILWYTQPAGASATAKLYEYTGLGKPILATIPPESEAARLIASRGLGVVVPPETPRIVEALQRIRRGELPFRGETLVEFSRENQVRRLIHIFEEVLQRRTSSA